MADDCCSDGDGHCAPPLLRLPDPQALNPPPRRPERGRGLRLSRRRAPLRRADPRYKRVLWTVIAVNGASFSPR